MIILMMPFFFTAIFEKDGIPFEKYIKYVIRQKYIYPKVRLYKTENFYEFLNRNGKEVEVEIGDRKSPQVKKSNKKRLAQNQKQLNKQKKEVKRSSKTQSIKQNKKRNIPQSAQQTLPYRRILPDGICQVDNKKNTLKPLGSMI